MRTNFLVPVSILIIIMSGCQINEHSHVVEVAHVDSLIFKSIGTLEMSKNSPLINWSYFSRSDLEETTLLSAFSPIDSTFYSVHVENSRIKFIPICSASGVERFNSKFLDSCSFITLDNETGVFQHETNGVIAREWKFEDFVPQVIPNREMRILDNNLYVLNSSSSHYVNQIDAAQSYYRDVNPILRFDIGNPIQTVSSIGRFPSWYSDAKVKISDYQPFFCVDSWNRCVLSFGFSDSLIVVEKNSVKSISCKSSFYEEPTFLTFKDGKSLSETRKFQTESARYMSIFFNSYRNEYYRFLKHKSEAGEPANYSIVVMDYEFNVLSEWIFDSSKFALNPLIFTSRGFLLPNIDVISETKRPHFEHFSM